MPRAKRHARKRGASPHSGVVLEKPHGTVGWRARWKDPTSNKLRKVTLDLSRYPEDRDREDFARRKAAELFTQRLDAREGVVSMLIADAVARYLALSKSRLRKRTVADYERCAQIFAAWCAGANITFARELDAAKLEAFRIDRLTLPRVRGEREGEQRSAGTLNVELAAVRTMLVSWKRLGWTPRLDRDAIADALRKERVDRDEVVFLRPEQCAKLLTSAGEHDRLTFKETRREHAGRGEPGTTLRYEPIAPFIATLLCTGMRVGEALALRWQDIDLAEAKITLTSEQTKTRRARAFDLDLAPVLKQLFNAMDKQRERARFTRRGLETFDHLPVFGFTRDSIEAARKRLLRSTREAHDGWGRVFYDIGPWSWQTLRRTAATALCNMQNVGPWQESQLLGHGVAVAEARYARRMKVSPDARTIEVALGLVSAVAELIEETTAGA